MRYFCCLILVLLAVMPLIADENTEDLPILLLPPCDTVDSIHLPETRYMNDMAVSADGQKLAVATLAGVEIYELARWQLAQTLPSGVPQTGVRFPSNTTFVTWSPDSIRLATSYNYMRLLPNSATEDIDQIYLWNAQTGERIGIIDTLSLGLAWSPEGSLLANNNRGGIELWDTDSLNFISRPNHKSVNYMAWNPDGTAIAGTNLWDSAWVWQLDTSASRLVTDDIGTVEGTIAWSSDGSMIVVGSNIGLVFVVDAHTQKELSRFKFDPDILSSVWSTEHSLLVTGHKGGLVLWENQFPDKPVRLYYPDSVDLDTAPYFAHLDWIPGTALLLSADQYGNIYKWDIENKCLAGIIQHPGD
jgi:WD40 repeat protein